MNAISVFCILCMAILPESAQEQQKGDLKSLQGKWVMIGLEVNGEKVPAEKITGTEMQIKGTEYVVKVKDKTHRALFELFPDKKPAAIDMTPQDGPHKDQVLKGVYRLKGDRLQICRGLQMGQARPNSFETMPGSGLFVVTWQQKTK